MNNPMWLDQNRDKMILKVDGIDTIVTAKQLRDLQLHACQALQKDGGNFTFLCAVLSEFIKQNVKG